MIVALIILGALVGVGLPLYLLHRADEHREGSAKGASQAPEAEAGGEADGEVCCGMHLTCEKDSLLADVSSEIEYFDDEDLDRFAGRRADGYSPQEVEEFRDVLLTLIPADIAPWARSIQLRGITLPGEVRDELLLIIAESRAHPKTNTEPLAGEHPKTNTGPLTGEPPKTNTGPLTGEHPKTNSDDKL